MAQCRRIECRRIAPEDAIGVPWTVLRTAPTVLAAVVAGMSLLAGCSQAPQRPPLEPQAAPEVRVPKVPEALYVGEPRVRLPIRDIPFVLSSAEPSDPLPGAMVPETLFYDLGVLEALESLFASARVPITVIASPSLDLRRITLVQRSPVRLSVLLDQIAADQGFFYSYSSGVLRLTRDRTFAVTLPPIGGGAVVPQSMQSANGTGGSGSGTGGSSQGNASVGGTGAGGTGAGGTGAGGSMKRIDEGLDIYAPIGEQLRALGAEKVQAGRVNRMILFSATRDRLPMIERYLDELRSRGKVIIVDTWIVDVQLSDSSDVGIDWSKAELNIGGGRKLNFAGDGSGLSGFSLGFSGSFGRVALDVLANFLASQGTAQTVASPRLAMVSGSRADFSSGENIPYVQSVTVGQGQTSSSALLSGGNIVFANVGLAVSMVGDAIDDTVFLSLGLRTSSLIEFRRFTIGGNSTDAPRTTERTYSAELRLPVGEAVVINGMRQSSDSVSRTGIPGLKEVVPGVAGRDNETRGRSELAVVLRPRVVEFAPDPQYRPAPPGRAGRSPAIPYQDDDDDRPAAGRPAARRDGSGDPSSRTAPAGQAAGQDVIDQELRRQGAGPLSGPLRLAPQPGQAPATVTPPQAASPPDLKHPGRTDGIAGPWRAPGGTA